MNDASPARNGHSVQVQEPEAQEMRLQIAGLAIDVHASRQLDLSTFAGRAKRYGRSSGKADEVIEVHPSPDEGDVSPWSGAPLVRSTRSGGISVEFSGARVDIPAEPGRVVAWIRREGPGYRFENVLRVLMSRRLLQSGGVMIHAAGLCRGRFGVAFPGVSGAGKSTLTLRHPEEERVSEDLLAVRRTSAGWTIDALPFIAFHELDLGPKSADLRGFAFLRQAERVQAKRMNAASVRSALARTVVSYGAFSTFETLALDRIVELSHTVPAIELEVNREDAVWPVLNENFSG